MAGRSAIAPTARHQRDQQHGGTGPPIPRHRRSRPAAQIRRLSTRGDRGHRGQQSQRRGGLRRQGLRAGQRYRPGSVAGRQRH